jgi:hypothetical protein
VCSKASFRGARQREPQMRNCASGNLELATSGFYDVHLHIVVHRYAMPRNDGSGALRRADPIAVKAIWHALAEMHQRDGARFDILRIEHRKIAAVLPRAPDRR